VYEPVLEGRIFVFRSLRKIFSGEELFINYNRDPASKKSLDPVYGIPPYKKC
jgi:hypothetical protein